MLCLFLGSIIKQKVMAETIEPIKFGMISVNWLEKRMFHFLIVAPTKNKSKVRNKAKTYINELLDRIKFLVSYIRFKGLPFSVYEHYLNISSHGLFDAVPLERYQKLVSDHEKPSLCIVDHPNQSKIILFNKSLSIPTIYCSQNIESLEHESISFINKNKRANLFPRLLNEISILEKCDFCLCISKVESGLLGGLGFPNSFYPYLPVGKIKDRLELIRRKRDRNKNIQTNHFLIIGSADHHTTYESLQWFLDLVFNHIINVDIKLTIVGSNTDQLIANKKLPSFIDIRGWLPQDQLDELMCNVNAVLIPQRIGFGALTRLPELSCAGIPAIVSRHATNAMNTLPGIIPVDDTWEDWENAIEELSKYPINPNNIDYPTWEKEQPKPLETLIKNHAKP